MALIDATPFLRRQVALDVCRLRRRHKNASLVMEKLTLMSSLHQTQPTIQILLSGNEFSGDQAKKNISSLRLPTRVTRLGEFSPNRQLFIWGRLF
jgi:hypothetical protein